jgi:hypothetical protein
MKPSCFLFAILFLLVGCVLPGAVTTAPEPSIENHDTDNFGYVIPNLGECFKTPSGGEWFCVKVDIRNPDGKHRIIGVDDDADGTIQRFAVFKFNDKFQTFTYTGNLSDHYDIDSVREGVNEACELNGWDLKTVFRVHEGAYLYIPGGMKGDFKIEDVNRIDKRLDKDPNRFERFNNARGTGDGTNYITRGIGRGRSGPRPI